MKRVFIGVVALAILALPSVAQADLITSTFTGSGSGTISGTPFSDSSFAITSVGDTANRYVPITSVYAIDNALAYITISGRGTYTFLTTTVVFNNLGNGTVGFAWTTGVDGRDLFSVHNVPELHDWDMLTSVGPVTANTGALTQWSVESVNTSGGVLVFTSSQNVPSTFAAVVVPEPSSFLAFLTGIGGLGGVMWRKRK